MKIQIINHHCTIEDISFAYAVHIREEQEETKFRVWAIPAATKRGVRGQDHRSEKRELREGEGGEGKIVHARVQGLGQPAWQRAALPVAPQQSGGRRSTSSTRAGGSGRS
jgi:hypothetical protein